jgi:hypothetical protein
MTSPAPIVVSEGGLPRMRELQAWLARSGIEAQVMRPGGRVGNG